MSDEPLRRPHDLLRDAESGDQVAFSEFCERHLPRLRRYVERMIRRQGLASHLVDDICHETVIRALRHIRRREDAPTVGAMWLQRIAYNATMDHHRTESRQFAVELFEVEAPGGQQQELAEVL